MMKYAWRALGIAAMGLIIFGCTAQEREDIAAIPSAAQTRAEQVEAQQMLQQIFKLQQAYFAMHKEYGADLGALGVAVPPRSRYQYALAATATSWNCSATANLDHDATVDRWVIDQSGRIACATDDATS